jgi:aryl-alcohol dehydrogenase-like predicted oxidoreductase
MPPPPADPSSLAPGRATPEGTADYATRLAGRSGVGHFRPARGLTVSSIGLGSYLGEPDAAADERYRAAALEAVRLGCNLIDTAINYRFQRSERALGAALAEMIGAGGLRREDLLVATKGGYVPFDGAPPADAAAWFHHTFVRTGIAGVQDLVAGCHCMTPAYLEHQVGCSRRNLGLECLDVYYLHNPEQQLDEVSRDLFRARLRAAFERLEALADRGWLGSYGTATWNGYRARAGSREHLSLQEVVEAARQVAGERHRFAFVQAPLNLAMPEALAARNQRVGGRDLTLLEAAAELGVSVVASASILQGRLARGLPSSLTASLPGLSSDAQRSLQFVRSAPGVTCALVGMKRVEHVRENLALAAQATLGERQFREAFL